MARRRKVSGEELELWRRVAARAERLHPAPKSEPAPLLQKPQPKPTPPIEEPFSFEPFRMGQTAAGLPGRHDLKPALHDRISGQPVRMDRKAFTRMKRGKLVPDARIDLHGMRLDRAHPALTRFILQSHAADHRLVLVITGKGKRAKDDGPIPTPRGVLKHNVPQWLAMPPLSQVVLQVAQAHISHGGEGAYYVYLRRNR
ncbi:Smr/MutS family protein [Pseudodonghicola xiamenensis]|uniref:DNA mismatch repair protein MutS n=1 Tax=Pseudodonghicola xiamenensis TaxID=337702 RepID=A0A8J3H5Q2_9RHOB|nr:Smr/MutS family protein [Pseudodonghicola xiamenensis]GHG83044.1 DNA mismatch repair protein MutS [Pseudodonghicola xiamenensis]